MSHFSSNSVLRISHRVSNYKSSRFRMQRTRISIAFAQTSLLLPALAMAKRKAHQVVCVNNQRQIELGYRMARDEDDGTFVGPAAIAWFVKHIGLTNEGWLCPSSPLNLKFGPGGLGGLVNYAWYDTEWSSAAKPSTLAEVGISEHELLPSLLLPGAINVAFYDGHVELIPMRKVWELTWHYDYEPPPKLPGDP
jgi:prepilin-type processing-associated H-X9-DG protein